MCNINLRQLVRDAHKDLSMLGILIALVVAGWNYLGPELSAETSVYAGLNVLLIAQVIFTLFTAIMSVVVFFGGIQTAKALGGLLANNAFGAVAGYAIPGFQIVMFVWFLVTRAGMLLGTWLMLIAGNGSMQFADMDLRRLICGAIIMVASVWISHKTMRVSVS